MNARGDLDNIRALLSDLAPYDGPRALEVILVVNNYSPDEPPAVIGELEASGAEVMAIPMVERRPGVVIPLAARLPGVERAGHPPRRGRPGA